MNMIKVSINYLPVGLGASSRIDSGTRMKSMTLKLTLDELKLLTTLASDQLFRRQFIDPRMPGYKNNPEEMNLGKALLARLQLMLGDGAPKKTPSPTS
jgi:hypothetical protein